MKTCPDCAEEVRSAARKCRFCGYMFTDQPENPEPIYAPLLWTFPRSSSGSVMPVDAIPAPLRPELLRVLAIRDDAERAREIGKLHRSGILPVTAELLIDTEEDPALRAVLVGMLREAD